MKEQTTILSEGRELALLASIINSSDDAILSKSLDGTITSWNHGAEKIFGYSAAEIIGQHIAILIPTFYWSEEYEIINKIQQGKVIEHYETQRIRKDGTIIQVSLTISPIKDADGNITGASKIARDITKQKEAEQKLSQSVKEVTDYKFALDEACIVAITDQKGIIKHANDNFCKISKYSREELIGQDHRIVNSGFHSKEFIQNLWVTISHGKIWRGEIKNKAKDGTIYWVDTTIIPFLNEQEKPYQYLAIRADITNRKLALEQIEILNMGLERRVKERTEELESFSYSVSHDLRAPLRAVHGYAEILEEDYANIFDEEGKRLLGEIQHNAKKMGILIDNLLSFSRLGRKEVEKSAVDMNVLTETVINEISQTTQHHAKIITGELYSVMADYALMQYVMINLISNAVKYSSKKDKPVIEINAKRENGELMYSIKDNGAGFGMEYADKLFGVFQRLHSDEEFPGNGIGLAMVQRIIYKHDGKIWAEGIEHKGATFYFSLPETSSL